ncbi:MAG: hypothetical protein GC160_02235 [Acidobacteria bacterium]|nr:hypothetical protein [Acidobacteriota bacterium]
MEMFPAADPIPLPAPVWLFKLLHEVTLTLHFLAVELLIGGLLVGLAWRWLARSRSDDALAQGSGMLAHRLPTVMAYVVNLGIPPLLFTQVLYGRALYTSSVLIGAYWISVIFLLIGSYYGLYLAAARVERKQPWGLTGLASLLLALAVGFIYTNNMTLMIRPEAWSGMYEATQAGNQLNAGDPTVLPRWFFFLAATLPTAGAGLLLLGLKTDLAPAVGRLLRFWGGALAAGGAAAVGVMAFVVLGALPEGVREGLADNAVYAGFGYVWWAAVALLIAVGARQAGKASAALPLAAGGAALAAFVQTLALVMVRDGIRDTTLLRAGFDVWDRQVYTNWSVVGLFLLLFVIAVGLVVWMARVAFSARKVEEKYV